MDDVGRRIAEAQDETLERVREMIACAIQWGPFSLSGSSGDGDKVRGYAAEGEGDQDYDYEVRRMQHFGLRTVPPKDVWAVRLAVGGGATNNVTVAEESDQYGPSDLDDGEVALYNKVNGTVIKIDKDGNIQITPAAGKDVIVNGGSAKVARVDDTSDGGTLVFQGGSGGATLTYFGPGVPPTGPGTQIPISGKINSGADHFKG